MKTSMFLAASGVVLALASPLDLVKRKMETELVIEWTTVYVTDESNPTFAAAVHHHAPEPTPTPSTTSTTPTPTPEPEVVAPEPTPTPAPVETVAPAPTPEPVTVQAAAPAADTPAADSPAPAPTVAAPQVGTSGDYASVAVQHHNVHRFNHSAPAIGWGQTYADYAAQTAAKCVFAHDLSPGGGGYGQNLALWGSSGDANALGSNTAIAQAVTDMWYNGELPQFPAANYGADNPDMSEFENWGHYTQLVWAGSQQVGCASQYCPAGTVYPTMGSWLTVCNYFPAGNMGGQYGKNVFPPLGEAGVTA